MTNTTSKLYEFNVAVEEKSMNKYFLNLIFLGDGAFYERLITIAKHDSVFLTRHSLPFLMKLLHQEKYIFYLEQKSRKKSKHVQWSLEQILNKDTDLLVFDDLKEAYEVKKALLFYINLFAREEALKYQLSDN